MADGGNSEAGRPCEDWQPGVQVKGPCEDRQPGVQVYFLARVASVHMHWDAGLI